MFHALPRSADVHTVTGAKTAKIKRFHFIITIISVGSTPTETSPVSGRPTEGIISTNLCRVGRRRNRSTRRKLRSTDSAVGRERGASQKGKPDGRALLDVRPAERSVGAGRASGIGTLVPSCWRRGPGTCGGPRRAARRTAGRRPARRARAPAR